MNFNLARYLSPSLGRWTQTDKIIPSVAQLGDSNLFVYVSNRTVGSVDPTGLFEFSTIGNLVKTFIHTSLFTIIASAVAGGAIFGVTSAAAGGSWLLGTWNGIVSGSALGYLWTTSKTDFLKGVWTGLLSGLSQSLVTYVAKDGRAEAKDYVEAFQSGFASGVAGVAFGSWINEKLEVAESAHGAQALIDAGIQASVAFVSTKSSGGTVREALVDATSQALFSLALSYGSRFSRTSRNVAEGRMQKPSLIEMRSFVSDVIGFVWGTDIGIVVEKYLK